LYTLHLGLNGMKSPHTTTRSAGTYLKIFLLFAISIQFSYLSPYIENADTQLFFWNQSVNIGILYAIIVGFLMSLSLTRKQLVEEKIGIELNKIRRMYHLSFHIAMANPELKAWQMTFVDAMKSYLGMFCTRSFREYEKGDALFRRMTYAIYELPSFAKRHGSYNSELYQFLLETTSAATEARQLIKSKKDDYIGHFQWGVILVITVTFAWIMTAATPHELIPRFVTTVVIFNLFLALDLLNEYDRINDKKSRALADLYVQNLQDVMTVCPPVTVRARRTGLRRLTG